jgi:hypothetical protein
VAVTEAGRAVLVAAGAPIVLAAGRDQLPPGTAIDDLHGLGTVLYELVVGAPPADPPVPPWRTVPELEPALNGLILALLSRDAERPPPPAAAVARRLRTLADGPPAVVAPPAAGSIVDGLERGLAEIAVYALIAALALVGVVAAYAATRTDDAATGSTTTVTVPGQVTLAPPPTATIPVATLPTEVPGTDADGVITVTTAATVTETTSQTVTQTTTQTVTTAPTTTG